MPRWGARTMATATALGGGHHAPHGNPETAHPPRTWRWLFQGFRYLPNKRTHPYLSASLTKRPTECPSPARELSISASFQSGIP